MGRVEPEAAGVPAGLVGAAPVPAAAGRLAAGHLRLQRGQAALQRRQLGAELGQLGSQLRDAALQRRAPITRGGGRRARAVTSHRLLDRRASLRLGLALLLLERLADEAGYAVLFLEPHVNVCAGRRVTPGAATAHSNPHTNSVHLRLGLAAAAQQRPRQRRQTTRGGQPLPETVPVTASSEPPASAL